MAVNLNIHVNLTWCGSCLSLQNVCVRFFVCICTLTCVRKVLEMAPTQQHVDFSFIIISKEEREMNIERVFDALSE